MPLISGAQTLGNVVYAGRFPVATGSALRRVAWYDGRFGNDGRRLVDVRSLAVG